MKRNLIRGLGLVVLGAAGIAGTSSAALAEGISGPAFYVDHTLYRTVATPTDLSGTGAPDQSWDTIYSFAGGLQRSVATAAPGDTDYNGGRWQAHSVSPAGSYDAVLAAGDLDHDGVLDSSDEIDAAIASGALVDNGVVRYFVCTVNKVPAGAS